MASSSSSCLQGAVVGAKNYKERTETNGKFKKLDTLLLRMEMRLVAPCLARQLK
jgi:hypothetical protein